MRPYSFAARKKAARSSSLTRTFIPWGGVGRSSKPWTPKRCRFRRGSCGGTWMPDVLVFGEDYAHEVVLRTLLDRLSAEYHVALDVQVRSATGGHGRVMRELREFIAELNRGRFPLPDLFIVARDANCLGYAARVKE